MPLVYEIDPARPRVLMTGTGSVTMADFDEVRAAMLANPLFRPSLDQLLDLTEAHVDTLTSADIRTLSEVTPFGPRSRRAIVASSAVAFGLARMFQILADDRRGTIRVFEDREAAELWLARIGEEAGV